MIPGLARLSSIDLGAETWSTPALLPGQGMIVAAARDGGIAAFGLMGDVRWRASFGEEITASPCVYRSATGDDRIVIGTHRGRLVSLDAATGETVWERFFGDLVRATVAAVRRDGRTRLYACSYGDRVWCLDGDEGSVLWSRRLPADYWGNQRGVVSSPAVADVDLDGRDEVLIGTRSWRCYCLDAETGFHLMKTCGVSDAAGLAGQPWRQILKGL